MDRSLIWTGDAGQALPLAGRRVGLYDTTLRDGEQTVGVVLDPDAKVEIARALDRLGVDRIEAGFPRVSDADCEAFRAMSSAAAARSVMFRAISPVAMFASCTLRETSSAPFDASPILREMPSKPCEVSRTLCAMPFTMLVCSSTEAAIVAKLRSSSVTIPAMPPMASIAAVTVRAIEFVLQMLLAVILLLALHRSPNVIPVPPGADAPPVHGPIAMDPYKTAVVLPGAIALTFMFVLGVAMPLSAWCVIYKDLDHIINIAMRILFYATPVFWALWLSVVAATIRISPRDSADLSTLAASEGAPSADPAPTIV